MTTNQNQTPPTGDSATQAIINAIGGLPMGSMPSNQPIYNPPPRMVYSGSRGRRPYTGPNLVDENDQMTNLTAYDTSEEGAKMIYGRMTPQARADVFSILQRKGFYGSRQPGFYANDINAIQQWLDYSNTLGVTSQRALNEMQKNLPDYGTSGGGGYSPRYRVSASDDLKAIARQVAQQTIGRDFTDEEANRFVSTYQQQEIQAQQAMLRGGIVQEAPSPDVFAQQFAGEVAPTEANGYKFLGYMNQILRSIGGE